MHPLRLIIALLVTILLIEACVLAWSYWRNEEMLGQLVTKTDKVLVEELPADFDVVLETFLKIAKEQGSVYAYTLLIESKLAPNLDLHLLGHEVGKALYDEYGIDAMQFCTPDLRNACSHAVVVNALLDYGMSTLDTVHDICKKAPGGPGAYSMCFHGLGHGVLAFVEYDFERAVEICATLGTPAYGNEEAGQCVGGAVMEMRDGTHDRATWEIVRHRFVDEDNPLTLCQASYMFPEAKPYCYSYLTPFLFDAAGAQGGLPQEAHYGPAFLLCEREPNETFRKMCYAGFGKEFIVLAGGYDIQTIDELPDEQLALAASWCEYGPNKEAVNACQYEIVHSLYWGGENNPQGAIRYCTMLTNETQPGCFIALYEDVSTYADRSSYKDFCTQVPQKERVTCEEYLMVQ